MILSTVAHQLHIARELSAFDTDLTTNLALTTEGDYAQKPTATTGYLGAFNVNKGLTNEMKVNGIAFSFIGTGVENTRFKWKLFTWRAGNGYIHQAAEGHGDLGTQGVIKFPHNGGTTSSLWADTLTVDWYNWYKRVDSTDTTGHDTVAEIWLDTCGHPWWYIEIETPGTGTPITLGGSYYGYF